MIGDLAWYQSRKPCLNLVKSFPLQLILVTIHWALNKFMSPPQAGECQSIDIRLNLPQSIYLIFPIHG